MENQYFLGQSLASSMSNWQSLSSSAMEIQPTTELNSTDYGSQFDSALSSMVSSPAASNSNLSNDIFMMRELIGKLGAVGNSGGEISPHPLMYGNNNSTNTSCYSTPLNSPPKLNLPLMVKEKLPSLGKSMGMNSTVADFSADPGFAERAAKFSCFGSRSFNGRTSQLAAAANNNNHGENLPGYRSNPLSSSSNGKLLPRVSSSPSLKAMVQQDRSELASSQEESSITNGDPKTSKNSKKRKAAPKQKPNATAKASEEESTEKRSKSTESKTGNQNGSVKPEEEEEEGKEKTKTPPAEPPKDYIHVRARRGQATDSHSLAERVRREKISERMKLLQDLVPGCNKVTGKALMLDEIINYVQSLQRQVEFLSMKLASVNTSLDFNMDSSLMPKDTFQTNNNLTHQIFPMDTSAASPIFGQQNPTMTQCLVDPAAIHPNHNNTHLVPPIHQFTQSVPQYQTFCEGDLQTIVEMGFGQNQTTQNFQGSNQVSNMKVEL